MLLQDLGEFGFIEQIAEIAEGDPRLVVGIGDDAAVLDLGGPDLTVVTTDVMLEGRHFSLDWLSPGEVGWRAGAAALSDLAAMGARPVAVFASAGLPAAWPAEQGRALVSGLMDVARSVGATLAGGDCAANEQVVLDVIALGTVPRGQQLLRSGARPGQVVAVTGALGAPGAAVALLKDRALKRAGHPPSPRLRRTEASGPSFGSDERLGPLRERFAHPQPRIAAGRRLAASGLVSGALDISDGLVADAGHLAERSGVAIIIEAEQVPVAEGCQAAAETLGVDPVTWALTGGEDFELLVALAEQDLSDLLELDPVRAIGLTVVGRVEDGEGVTVLDRNGQPMHLSSGGWDHFTAPG